MMSMQLYESIVLWISKIEQTRFTTERFEVKFTEDAVVVEEISPVDIRLLVVIDRAVEGKGDGGEAALPNDRVGLVDVVVVVFVFNSPSGIVSNFSVAVQLEEEKEDLKRCLKRSRKRTHWQINLLFITSVLSEHRHISS